MEPNQVAYFEFDLETSEVVTGDVEPSRSSEAAGLDNSWRVFGEDAPTGWAIGTIFDGELASAAEEWRNSGDVAVFDDIDGDFACIVRDPEKGRVALINGPNGKYRLYYCRDGDTLYVSNHLWTFAARLEEVALSGFGLYNYFGLGHSLDPCTLFEGVRVVELGEAVTATEEEMGREKYHPLLDPRPETYAGLDEAVDELERVLERVFAKRSHPNRESVVLLSGGIDSVAMLDYLNRVEGSAPRSVTFAMKGNSIPDEEAAKNAAAHFGSTHDMLEIEPSRGWEYFVRGLSHADTPHFVATMYRGAIETAAYSGPGKVGDGKTYRTLFSGQDHRLHTPSLPKAKEIGLKRNFFDLPLSKVEKAWEAVLKYAKHWPYRGGGAAENFVETAKERSSPERFLLEVYAGHDPELERESDFGRLTDELEVGDIGSMGELHRTMTMFLSRFQHTNNNNEVRSGFETRTNRVDLPYYDHEFIEASSRVPFIEAAEPKLTLNSGHAIPISRKRVMRRMLDDSIPDEILWRRGYASFPYEDLFTEQFRRSASRLLSEYRAALFEHLDSEYHEFLTAYLKPTLDALPEKQPPFPRELFYLLYLASVFAARDRSGTKRPSAAFLKQF